MKQPCIYIITNRHNTTLYIGVTSHLVQCIYQHKHTLIEGFSAKYHLEKLIMNPVWRDLYPDLIG